MIGWLKRLMRQRRADREELEGWRLASVEVERWLGEFPDVVDALAHMRDIVAGADSSIDVREKMRSRRTLGEKIAADLAAPRKLTVLQEGFTVMPQDRAEVRVAVDGAVTITAPHIALISGNVRVSGSAQKEAA